MITFYHKTIDAPLDWLEGYLGDLLRKGEVFYWEEKGEIIGACEVRKSVTHPEIADIGMLVSPSHRKQGYGSFLLHQAKTKALEWGKKPICSCEKDNIGSLKSKTQDS